MTRAPQVRAALWHQTAGMDFSVEENWYDGDNMGTGKLTPQEISTWEHQAARESYWIRVLVQLDILGNVLMGGHPDETISARCGRLQQQGNWIGKFMCWWLDWIQPQHGMRAEAGDLERGETVATIEQSALDVSEQSSDERKENGKPQT